MTDYSDESNLINKRIHEYEESFMSRLEKLKRKHEEVKNEYAKMFCERMGLDDDFSYFSGNIFCVGDYFIDMRTIVWAINNLVDEEKFFEWYDYNLFIGENELGEITLEDYCNGKRRFSEEDINRIKSAKSRINEATREFEDIIFEITHKDGN